MFKHNDAESPVNQHAKRIGPIDYRRKGAVEVEKDRRCMSPQTCGNILEVFEGVLMGEGA